MNKEQAAKKIIECAYRGDIAEVTEDLWLTADMDILCNFKARYPHENFVALVMYDIRTTSEVIAIQAHPGRIKNIHPRFWSALMAHPRREEICEYSFLKALGHSCVDQLPYCVLRSLSNEFLEVRAQRNIIDLGIRSAHCAKRTFFHPPLWYKRPALLGKIWSQIETRHKTPDLSALYEQCHRKTILMSTPQKRVQFK